MICRLPCDRIIVNFSYNMTVSKRLAVIFLFEEDI